MKYSYNPSKDIIEKQVGAGFCTVDNRKEATVDELIEIIKKDGYVAYIGGDEWLRCRLTDRLERDVYDTIYSKCLYVEGTAQEHRELEQKLRPIMDTVIPHIIKD